MALPKQVVVKRPIGGNKITVIQSPEEKEAAKNALVTAKNNSRGYTVIPKGFSHTFTKHKPLEITSEIVEKLITLSGLSEEDFADKLKVSKVTLKKWLDGKSPTYNNQKKIHNVFKNEIEFIK